MVSSILYVSLLTLAQVKFELQGYPIDSTDLKL